MRNPSPIVVPFLSTDTNYSGGDFSWCCAAIFSCFDYFWCPDSPNLAANEENVISYSLKIPEISSGNYYFLFVADPRDEIGESDENNNVAYIAFTVL